MKRKIFSVALIAIFVMSLVAGCGQTKENVKESTEKVESTQTTQKTLNSDGITVTGLVDKATNVELKSLTDGDDYTSVTDYLSTLTDKNITATKVYDINLLDKNKSKVQPKDSVKIQLTLPDELVNAEGDDYEVYRKESNNTFTSLKSTIVDKEISFDTEHFSIYVVVKTSNAPIENTESTESTEPEQQSTYSYTDKSATMYAKSSVNVRDLPDTNGNKVGGLSTNQEVSVTGQCNETGWYRINYNGGTAYVSNSYLGDSKVDTKKNTNSNTGTSSNTSNQQPAAPSDNGSSNAGNTASEELPSNPYPLNTLVEDTGSSISFYLLDIPGQGMTTPYEMGGKSAEYVMSIGKTPDVMVCDGVMGRYKEGVVAKWTRPYH